MLYCKICDNDRIFLQSYGFLKRDILIKNKNIIKGQWKTQTEQLKNDIYCSNCNTSLDFTQKMFEKFDLIDYPLNFKKFKIEEILREIKKYLRGAIIKTKIFGSRKKKVEICNFKKVNIPDELVSRLQQKSGINLVEPYSHQTKALNYIFHGKNVVISTPTSSGKSLIYTVPILSNILNKLQSTALMVFPTKALSFDQMRTFLSLGDDFNEFDLLEQKSIHLIKFKNKQIICGKFDGDTRDNEQKDIKDKARIVITNPDALHFKILPYITTKFKGSWETFLQNLSFIVLDEIHTYRGTFGANVGLLLRRLQLICQNIGNNNIQFICASATISNPLEHAERLVGKKFELVNESGAPAYKKAFILVNPPIKDNKTNERIEPITLNLNLLEKIFIGRKNPSQTISFARSRGAVEDLDEKLRARLNEIKSPYANRTGIYKSTIIGRDRIKIQNCLKNREIVHIATTNALELGIDIGDLDVCIINHYPGNIASVIQQSGRVGRKKESITVLILKNTPLEQYFAQYPEFFFEQFNNLENAKIPIENTKLIENHILCANWESRNFGGYSEKDYLNSFGPKANIILANYKQNGFVYEDFRGRGELYWKISKGGPDYKERYKNIRLPLSTGARSVVDKNSKEEVGVIDSYSASRDLFKGAVWRNNGVYYLSNGFGPNDQQIIVEDLGIYYDYYTISIPKYKINLNKEKDRKMSAGIVLAYHDINVTREINLYKKIFRDGHEDVCLTKSIPIAFDTDALFVKFTEDFVTKYNNLKKLNNQIIALHGFEHIFRSILPIIADCDPNDLESWFDEEKRNVYIFDTMAGGIGYSLMGYERFNKVISLCHKVLKSCKCKLCCPQCLIVPWCSSEIKLDRKATLTILEELIR